MVRLVLKYLVFIVAIIMAGTIAYISVNGLLMVFSGSGLIGLLLFSSIELSKLVSASLLHTYKKEIKLLYRLLLSLFIIISMLITSMGVYGFLSSSYEKSHSELVINDNKLSILNDKKIAYENKLNSIKEEQKYLNEVIKELTHGLSNNVIQYKDKESGQIITTTSSSNRRVLKQRLDEATKRYNKLDEQYNEIQNKLFDLNNEIYELNSNNVLSDDLGPLKYLSRVTGYEMDYIMKWFILLLIFIGDPMAVLMVIILNKINYVENHNKIVYPKVKINNPNNDDDNIKVNNTLNNNDDNNIKVNNPSNNNVKNDGGDLIKNKNKDVIEKDKDKSPDNKNKQITLDDIKEVKERKKKFSVDVPVRNVKNNIITRIGSNKEIRGNDPNKIYYKKK